MAKKIIIIAIILVLIALVLLFLSGQREAPITNYPATAPPGRGLGGGQLPTTNQPVVNQPVAQLQELTAEGKLTLLKNGLALEARNFAERYGTYSTDAKFANLRDLKDKMTARFWQETESYISVNEKKETKEFYGVTTKVLNISEKDFSNDKILYLISTQRQETRGTTPKVFYQDLELIMVEENNTWKVDKVNWK